MPFGINLAAGALAMLGATAVSALASPERSTGLAVVALTVFGYAVLVDDIRAVFAVAGIGYLLYDGFLVNRYGDLTWEGTTSLGVFALAVGAGAAVRWLRHARARARVSAELDDLLRRTDTKESHRA